MKKLVSLLLAIVLTLGFAGSSAFADSDSPDLMPQLPEQDDSQSQESSSEQEVTPEFIGGAFVSATIPQSIVVGETASFYVSIQNFINGEAYDLTGLTALITGTNAESFELLQFYRTDEGLVYFTVKAKDICPIQSFSVVVTDGMYYSLPFVFQTSIIEAPVSEEDSSSGGESEPEPEPESEESSSSVSSSEESSNREPESRESSSQPNSVAGQGSSAGDSGNSVGGENGEGSGTPEEEEDTDNGADEQQMPEIVYPQENPADMFMPRAAALRVPQIVVNADPATESEAIDNLESDLTKVSAWQPQSGIPDLPKDGATISSTTALVFAIPTDNFAFDPGSSGTIDTNITELNNNSTGPYKVEVMDKKKTDPDMTVHFSIEFVKIAVTGGHAYAVKLTPDNVTGEITLEKGTTFGFSSQRLANQYALDKDLTIVNAKNSSKAIGLNGHSLRSKYTWMTKNGRPGGDLDSASAGDEFLIHFSPQFFDWDGDMPATVTLSSIRSNISLKQVKKTSRVFEKIELTSVKGEAVVRIKFKDVIPRTREMEYGVTLYLAVKGARDEDTELQIDGTLGSEDPDEFYSEDKDIDISDGRVGKAMENIRNARVDIGQGVTVNVPVLRKGLKFFGVAVTGPEDSRDEELLDEYPDIVEIYTLYTLGLNGAESTVDIDTFTGYYIYDSNLRYLGEQPKYMQSSSNYYLAANLNLGNKPKNLPFSNKYYLAAKLLDVPDEDEDDDWPPEYEDFPSDFFPENENANPATGK